MSEDFETKFNDIIKENDFSDIESEDALQQITVLEVSHTLELINAAALQLSSILYEALVDKAKFPTAAVEVFRRLHSIADEFIDLTADIEECDCDECKEEEDE